MTTIIILSILAILVALYVFFPKGRKKLHESTVRIIRRKRKVIKPNDDDDAIVLEYNDDALIAKKNNHPD
jgi:hypothetical protein